MKDSKGLEKGAVIKMSNVNRSTRAALEAAGGIGGVISILDIATGRKFNVRCALGSYWHIDYQAETKADWDVICEITKGNPRDARWPARSVVVPARNGTLFGFGMFTYNHEPLLYKAAYNPGPGTNAHCCLHPFFALGERPGGPNDQYQRGNKAAIAAESASSVQASTPVQTVTTVNYLVELISGPVNIRFGAGTTTTIAKVGIRSPKCFRVDREQQGPDSGAPGGFSLWGRIAEDKELTGRWIALRLTQRVADKPVVPLPPPPATLLTGNTYIVEPGDTLFRIGNKVGKPWQDIASVNGLREPYTIMPGLVLRIL